VLESMVELIAGVECQRRFSPRGRVEYSYDVELYASAKMFASIISVRFLKHLLELQLL
jgi:hypothetical protein